MLIILAVGIFSLQPASAQSDKVIQTLTTAFQTRNADTLKSLLGEHFSVSVYSNPNAFRMLKQIFDKQPALQKMELLQTLPGKEGTQLQVKYYFEKQTPTVSNILLDKDGKIDRVRLFDQLYGAKLDTTAHEVGVIPFVMENKKIVVQIKINNHPKVLRMLFDTGADGVGLKKEVADELGLTGSREQQTSIVGGSAKITISENNILHLAEGIQLERSNIAIFPKYDGELDGLFGGNVMRKYSVCIDFDKSVLRLYTQGEIAYPKGGFYLPLVYRGTPEIATGINIRGTEHLAHLAFDTGAGYNVILFGPYVHNKNLMERFRVESYSQNISFGHTTKTAMGKIDTITLGATKIPALQGSLQQYEEGDERWSPMSDGSLGIDVIKQFNIYINAGMREFYLIPNNNFGYPGDFWMAQVQYGFEDGKLKVMRIYPDSPAATAGLAEGDEVQLINNIKPLAFKNIATIEQYQREWKRQPINITVKREGKTQQLKIASM